MWICRDLISESDLATYHGYTEQDSAKYKLSGSNAKETNDDPKIAVTLTDVHQLVHSLRQERIDSMSKGNDSADHPNTVDPTLRNAVTNSDAAMETMIFACETSLLNCYGLLALHKVSNYTLISA